MTSSEKMISNLVNKIQPVLILDKIRLGRKMDGGYVISQATLKKTKILVSLGINDEWSFEKDCILKFNLSHVVMIDMNLSYKNIIWQYIKSSLVMCYRPNNITVQKSYILNKYKFNDFNKLKTKSNIKYSKYKIGNNVNELSLIGLLKKYRLLNQNKSVFIKIDIEGSEYSIIEQISLNASIFSGIVIEFHNIIKAPEMLDLALTILLKDFYIGHIHLNNYTSKIGALSDALELSFIPKSMIPNPVKDFRSFPITSLDYPCNPEKEDYNFQTKIT